MAPKILAMNVFVIEFFSALALYTKVLPRITYVIDLYQVLSRHNWINFSRYGEEWM